MQFDNEHTNLMAEYFPDCPAEKLTETTSRIFVDVPAKERLWKALLLSFGNKIIKHWYRKGITLYEKRRIIYTNQRKV